MEVEDKKRIPGGEKTQRNLLTPSLQSAKTKYYKKRPLPLGYVFFWALYNTCGKKARIAADIRERMN